VSDHEPWSERLSLYFDGELPREDEPALLEHLAGCAQCDRELEGAIGLHEMLASGPGVRDAERAAPDSVARSVPEVASIAGRAPRAGRSVAPGWRRYAVAGAALALAASAALVWSLRDRTAPDREPQVALAPTRTLEARFEASPFAAHRPYGVVRGATAHEPIALESLAALQRHGETSALVAALAASGDLARAEAVAQTAALSVADRAALALAGRRPEDALTLLDGKATTPAARWNAALAFRDLGFRDVARAELLQLAQLGERGWSDEAQRLAGALGDGQRERAEFRAFQARGLAMIAGTGPAIAQADVARFPAFARIYFLDALRTAGDRAAALALAPIAEALDRASGEATARAALDRVASARFDVRARFNARYRALVARTLDPAASQRLVAELERAGHDVDDIFVGSLTWTGQLRARIDQLEARVEHDPWFELVAVRERLAIERADHGAAAVAGRLRAAADGCGDAWAYRCAQLSLDAAEATTASGLDDEALRHATRARAQYAAAGAPLLEDRALAYLGELARYRDRRALARAMFRQVELAAGDCTLVTYARIGRAKLALVDGKLDQARELLPAPDACGRPPDPIAVTIAVDLARQSGAPADRVRAATWLDASRVAGDPALAGLAEIGAARIAIAADPSATAGLSAWLAAHASGDANLRAGREWAASALIAAAGERADWAAADAAARTEIDAGVERDAAACLVVASVDQDRQTVAVRGNDGRWRGSARRAPLGELESRTFIPPALVAPLTGCARVEVLARPPLHGRTDLLSPSLPWAFVGGPPHRPPGRAARTVIVTDVEPPAGALGVPRLEPRTAFPDGAVVVRGAAATPARVLAELADATYVEIDAHGVADVEAADASFLALSPEPSGRFMLDAASVVKARLDGPVVVLAACRGARLAPYLHRRWTLPDAFLTAGARAVIATDLDVPDATAGPVFDEIRVRIERGEPPEAAVAAVRAAAVAREAGTWVSRIAVFE